MSVIAEMIESGFSLPEFEGGTHVNQIDMTGREGRDEFAVYSVLGPTITAHHNPRDGIIRITVCLYRLAICRDAVRRAFNAQLQSRCLQRSQPESESAG